MRKVIIAMSFAALAAVPFTADAAGVKPAALSVTALQAGANTPPPAGPVVKKHRHFLPIGLAAAAVAGGSAAAATSGGGNANSPG